MFGDLFTYGCNNINELSPAFQRKIYEFIGKRRMIPVKMHEDIVKDCVPSEGMKKAMADEVLSKERFIPLVLNSPVKIEVKERCLSELAATDDMLKNIADFNEFWQELKGTDLEECEAKRLYERIREKTAGEYLEIIKDARRELLEMNPGEVLYLKEAWYDDEVLDEQMKERGTAAFMSFDAARNHIRREMSEEEWDEDTCCWNVLEKWKPGMDGIMDKVYTYYLIGEDVVYIDTEKFRNGRFERGLSGDFNGIYNVAYVMQVPFEVGDIVLIDQRPFAPVRHGLILCKGGFKDDNYVLYKDIKGFWNLRNLKSIKAADGVMYSCYYRMERLEGELPEEERLLLKAQDYILADEMGKGKGYKKRKRKRGERIDRLLLFGDDRLTDEELEMELENLVRGQMMKQTESKLIKNKKEVLTSDRDKR